MERNVSQCNLSGCILLHQVTFNFLKDYGHSLSGKMKESFLSTENSELYHSIKAYGKEISLRDLRMSRFGSVEGCKLSQEYLHRTRPQLAAASRTKLCSLFSVTHTQSKFQFRKICLKPPSHTSFTLSSLLSSFCFFLCHFVFVYSSPSCPEVMQSFFSVHMFLKLNMRDKRGEEVGR